MSTESQWYADKIAQTQKLVDDPETPGVDAVVLVSMLDCLAALEQAAYWQQRRERESKRMTTAEILAPELTASRPDAIDGSIAHSFHADPDALCCDVVMGRGHFCGRFRREHTS